MSRKRLYQLSYPANDEPVWLDDISNKLRLSGAFYQGMDLSLLLLFPSADSYEIFINSRDLEEHGIVAAGPSVELWSEILRRSDDPVYFELDETGTIKAVHRKAQRAISGAIQQQIWARDGFRCMLCGQPMGKVQLTVDHWIPLELGGQDDAANYLAACRGCGKLKGSRNPKDFCESKGYDYDGLCAYLEGLVPASMIAHLTRQEIQWQRN